MGGNFSDLHLSFTSSFSFTCQSYIFSDRTRLLWVACIKATFLTQKSIVCPALMVVVAEMAPQPIEWWAIALLCQNASAHSCCHYGAIIVSQPLIASSMEHFILKEKMVCIPKKMVWNEQTQFKDQIKTWKWKMKIPISAIHVYKFYFCDCFELSLSRAGEDKFKSHPC